MIILNNTTYNKYFLFTLFVALHKAGRHMEDSIVAAYVSLLIGCLIENNIVSIAKFSHLHIESRFCAMYQHVIRS